jgi:DNA adenine methylase
MKDKDWVFQVSDWRKTMAQAQEGDFVYLDPPYIGRNTDYYNNWTETDAIELAQTAQNLPCGFALSMWLENKYRKNEHIETHWNGLEIRTFAHFYHVGASEDLRNEMQEALVLPMKNSNKNSIIPKNNDNPIAQYELFM